jgi:hypothetical protein
VNPIRRLGAASVAAGLALMVLSGAGTAVAAPRTDPRACPPRFTFAFSGVRPYFVTNPGHGLQKTAPGGHRISMTVLRGQVVHGLVAGTGRFSVSMLVTAARLKINLEIGYDKTQPSTRHSSFTVPAGWAHGWLAWGAAGYRFDWKEIRIDAACKPVVLAAGTATLPARPGFGHGRGISPPVTP